MDSPAAILALILTQTAVGGLVFTWFAPTWGHVRHGYEMLVTATLALMSWGAWAALDLPLATVAETSVRAADLATWTGRGVGATTILAGLAVLALAVRLTPLVGRVLGVAATLVGVVTLVPFAGLRTLAPGSGSWALGVAEVALGAVLLGAIWVGMVLGHWYLVERRLSNAYMVWIARVNVAAVVAGFASVGLSALNDPPCVGLEGASLATCASTISPLLSVNNMTLLIGFGIMSLIAVIAGFNLRLANEGGRSIQASTGMFYLAVILAPAAEFAAKLRFF
jgi:hypothetical protein